MAETARVIASVGNRPRYRQMLRLDGEWVVVTAIRMQPSVLARESASEDWKLVPSWEIEYRPAHPAERFLKWINDRNGE